MHPCQYQGIAEPAEEVTDSMDDTRTGYFGGQGDRGAVRSQVGQVAEPGPQMTRAPVNDEYRGERTNCPNWMTRYGGGWRHRLDRTDLSMSNV